MFSSFRCPLELQVGSLSDKLDALEEFWESEAPRAGEEHSVGWADWLSAGGDVTPIVTENPAATQMEGRLDDGLAAWHQQECHLDRVHKLPSRSTDAESDEDPFATVLFTDIRPFLTELLSLKAKRIFKFVCLDILGLHIPNLVSALSAHWKDGEFDSWTTQQLSGDSYIRRILPTADTRVRIQSDAYAGITVGRQKEYRSSCGPIRQWGWGLQPPLTLCHAQDKKTWIWDQDDVVGAVDVEVVRRFFSQFRDARDEEWDDYALEFEVQVNVKRCVLFYSALM